MKREPESVAFVISATKAMDGSPHCESDISLVSCSLSAAPVEGEEAQATSPSVLGDAEGEERA